MPAIESRRFRRASSLHACENSQRSGASSGPQLVRALRRLLTHQSRIGNTKVDGAYMYQIAPLTP